MRVLITRPEKYGLNLAEKIKPLGFIPELLPTIHFQPTLQQPLLQTAIEQLDRIMIAIFVSQAAVDFSFPLIKATWQPLPDIQWGGHWISNRTSFTATGHSNNHFAGKSTLRI